ncbi:MAG: glycosyltransferase family 4 protein [Clostridia bacterium]|nr:glycosyltransferase family 4 protein [Clostridia bacterium]
MRKVLMLCPTSRSVKNFRLPLIRKLVKEGYSVTVCAFDDEYKSLINETGAKMIVVKGRNRSLNPFALIKLKKSYVSIIKQEKPDVVLTFVLKPNVYGSLACKKAGVTKVYSFVEGAGDVFINNSLKWKLVRFVVCKLYKKAFKISRKVFFLNNDDKNEFVNRNLVFENKCEIIHGVGVDIERFSPKPIENRNTFLMIARLLKTKGVIEYCEAARKVKKLYPQATFNLLGPEGTLTKSDIQQYIDDGSISYFGETTDVRPYIEDCSVHVLPSYREGLGLVNAEAGAMGRPIITGDTNGTRDTVIDGYNGFLVPIKNSEALAEKMIYFLENPQAIETMGLNARKYAEENFDQNKINEKICEIIL